MNRAYPEENGEHGVDDTRRGSRNDSEALSALGYSGATLGIFKKIDSLARDGQTIPAESEVRRDDHGLREKYKSLIRQLPARTYVDKLVATFFREVNWQYSFLDPTTFTEYLQNWNDLSFEVLNKGPQDLPRDLRFFPGLLFQVLALALQFQPLDYEPSLDSLKYVSSMSFDDLASDYSESGLGVLTILGKRDITLVAVQTGFLRTAYLKNSGQVTESWHCLGQAIRDAQECGLHKDTIAAASDSAEEALEAVWLLELRRRTWTSLCLWDVHMSLVLGRPHSIDSRDLVVTLPLDTPVPKNKRKIAPFPRSENDPPTPLTLLIRNAENITVFREIAELEKEGPHPKDYSKVERVHQMYLRHLERLPAFFRSENPDTTFDSDPDCYWLQAARTLLDTNSGFTIMSLHRPYVFTIAKSRSEALEAGLDILRAQRRLFQYLQARHYKMFNLVLSTFDAIVLVAAVYILHPNENPNHLDDALQHFEWAMERFETMSARNPMAKGALGVLQAIHVRLLKSLEKKDNDANAVLAPSTASAAELPTMSSTESPASSSSRQRGEASQGSSISSISGSSRGGPSRNARPDQSTSYPATPGDIEIGQSISFPERGPAASVQTDMSTQGATWNTYGNNLMPNFDGNNFDFASMAPLQPIHDLLYNDLVGLTPTPESALAANAQTFYDPGMPWQFEGDFADDSFWNFMNQYKAQ
ncbi:MAG: hypothetical protein M1818_006611 [Claussenomyces sp. TS43310]|nr:MAG: hypothetical protein M1818_006954 [Claussenomyces sp. TS43310]KAI9735034.1 MAG: hypothetical protein M1818_006611 [Claussenomyces sp. TS43310]